MAFNNHLEYCNFIFSKSTNYILISLTSVSVSLFALSEQEQITKEEFAYQHNKLHPTYRKVYTAFQRLWKSNPGTNIDDLLTQKYLPEWGLENDTHRNATQDIPKKREQIKGSSILNITSV